MMIRVFPKKFAEFAPAHSANARMRMKLKVMCGMVELRYQIAECTFVRFKITRLGERPLAFAVRM